MTWKEESGQEQYQIGVYWDEKHGFDEKMREMVKRIDENLNYEEIDSKFILENDFILKQTWTEQGIAMRSVVRKQDDFTIVSEFTMENSALFHETKKDSLFSFCKFLL